VMMCSPGEIPDPPGCPDDPWPIEDELRAWLRGNAGGGFCCWPSLPSAWCCCSAEPGMSAQGNPEGSCTQANAFPHPAVAAQPRWLANRTDRPRRHPNLAIHSHATNAYAITLDLKRIQTTLGTSDISTMMRLSWPRQRAIPAPTN
jgi:hypothetical protein